MTSLDYPTTDGYSGEIVIVLDFGAQYTQLIARRVRECNVYCEILPFDTPVEKVLARTSKTPAVTKQS